MMNRAILALFSMSSERSRGPFTVNNVMAELSYAYVHAVAAQANFSCEPPKIDLTSVDAMIKAHEQIADARYPHPQIDLQLKAVSTIELNPGSAEFSFPLKMKNYEDLRVNRQVPILLVVLLMPRNRKLWLTSDDDSLIMRRCAYWCSLRGEPAVKNKTYRTVRVKLKNRFDPKTLRRLMGMSAREEVILNDLP